MRRGQFSRIARGLFTFLPLEVGCADVQNDSLASVRVARRGPADRLLDEVKKSLETTVPRLSPQRSPAGHRESARRSPAKAPSTVPRKKSLPYDDTPPTSSHHGTGFLERLVPNCSIPRPDLEAFAATHSPSLSRSNAAPPHRGRGNPAHHATQQALPTATATSAILLRHHRSCSRWST
jgi:hypothetical protein